MCGTVLSWFRVVRVQQVSLWGVWYSFEMVWGSEGAAGGIVDCVVQFGVGLGECVFTRWLSGLCGTILSWFRVVRVQQMGFWSVCGTVWSGFRGLRMQQVALWSLWYSLEWVYGSKCAAGGFLECVVQFEVDLGE